MATFHGDLEPAISGVYAAAAGRLGWHAALSEVARALDLWAVQVLGVDTRTGRLVFSSYGGATPQTSLDYLRYYSTVDPRMSVGMATPAAQWMHCHEHFDDAYVERSEFYQDFLIPHGGRYVSATKLIEDDDVQFILALVRGTGKLPFGPADGPALARMKQHCTEAFRNLVHVRDTLAELEMARGLLGDFGHPMLLVDEAGAIWHANDAARVVLAQRDPVAEENGSLVCVHRGGHAALAQALQAQQGPAQAGTGPQRRRTVALPTADGRRFLAFVSTVDPQAAMGALGITARTLVILHDTREAQVALNPMIVGECFGLTPAEARVAVHIANGKTVQAIAQQHGATVATVRSQLGSAMEKIGVQRQAQLARALLALPVRR